MKSIFKQSLKISIFLLVLCGLVYPLAVTGAGQLLFHHQANGSMIQYNNKTVGSELLGQDFTDTRFFHGRVSSIGYNTYEGTSIPTPASGSTNYALSNPAFQERLKKDIDAFLKENPGTRQDSLPVDLFTNSGSGLDPDISPAGAAVQLPLIAKTTKLSLAELQRIVDDHTTGRTLGIFGEPRVNVLKCNLELAKRLGIQ